MIYQIFDSKRLDIKNRYACLVAEAMANVSDSQKQLVGLWM
jgi:hypothetical protein